MKEFSRFDKLSNVLARIFFIDRTINEKGRVSKEDVADNFGVSVRTVTNDIKFMRDTLEVEIIPSKQPPGYYIYETKNSFYPDFTDEKLLLTHSFLKSMLESYLYIPILSKQIIKEVKSLLSPRYQELSENIIYEVNYLEQIDDRTFKKIISSFNNKKKLRIEYHKLDGSKTSNRIIEPLKLINFGGIWHLVSYCYLRNEIRNFRVAGIYIVDNSDIPFEDKASEIDVEGFIKDSFGMFLSQPDDEVIWTKIRFYGYAMNYIKKQKLHPKQKTTSGNDELKGEYIEIELPVKYYKEVIMKVLQYGVEAEVISPPDFREKWLESIKDMYNNYIK